MAVPLTKENKRAPVLRVRTTAGTAEALRVHFFRHNLRVLALAVGTLMASAAAWVLLYLVCWWLLVLGLAVIAPDRDEIPRGYGAVFATVAICATVYAWIDQRLTPNVRLRDKKNFLEVIVDILLVVPNMTLSIVGTLRAWQHLRPPELEQAAALLHRLAEERRVPMSGVRQQIPDPDTAMRVIFALQLGEIVEVHRDESEFSLRLNALRPDSLRFARGEVANA
jgi:hypothetical protein